MFPTFISIIDIQSWWEVPSIAHFCSLFRTAFNLLDFDIEDLEEALLTDGTEESSWLQELIVRLLSGSLPSNEISTFNYQMFLRRLFRQKCQEHDRYNPFNTDIDFQLLPLRTKVDILHALCDFRLDAEDVLDQLKNLEADSLRVEPLGYDSNESAYWYFYGTRLYREDFTTKNNKKKSVWQVICFTEDDWFQLTKKFKKSSHKAERQLYQTLSENFLPELPRLFKEKENLARKRLLENQPRRTSSRLRKLECEAEKEVAEKSEKLAHDEKQKQEEEKLKKDKDKKDLEKRRQEAYERRAKLKEPSEEEACLSEESTERYEMAGQKSKKVKGRQRKASFSSNSSKDNTPKSSKRAKKLEKELENITKVSSNTTTVGRQTNNSLSAATGQILIQALPNTNKKKLKTFQVFRQTDEDLQTGMHKILDFVKNHEDAWPFADPVEEEYAPNYYSVISKPMDLQKMEERLDSGYYKNFAKFRADFQLIVDNCRLYNGVQNEYTEMVDNLLKVFEQGTEKYLDQISSSEDEIAIEYSNVDSNKTSKRKKSVEEIPTTTKRKPMLAAQTDKKRERSVSEDSLKSQSSYESLKTEQKNVQPKKSEKTTKKQNKSPKSKKEKVKEVKKIKNDKKDKTENKKEKSENKKNKSEIKKENSESKQKHESKKDKTESKSLASTKKTKKANKKIKKKSPTRSRSSSPSRSPPKSNLSSPPPSWPPSSPDTRLDFSPKKNSKKRTSQDLSDSEEFTKSKTKRQSKSDDYVENSNDFSILHDKELSSPYPGASLSPKPKDKHNKLRETIEKLKAKNELKLKDEFDFELDHSKENKDKNKKQEKEDKIKSKVKENVVSKPVKIELDLDLDGNSTMDSVLSDSKKVKKNVIKTPISIPRPTSNLDALTIATEQTLKDINKWLDDTPKFSEFSSASNSPSYTGLDDFDAITSKIETVPSKKIDKPPGSKKEAGNKEIKKKPFRDPSKFFKRREVQRTIDRLQPGKSKGNLISNVQNTNKVDEIFPLGPLSKIKDTKNSLIVKTDTNAPKLSLGSVLDSFGKHNFVDDQKKEEQKMLVEIPKQENSFSKDMVDVESKNSCGTNKEPSEVKDVKKEKESSVDDMGGGATPNLSAWFKAFGAPKVQPTQKKSDVKSDGKENEKVDDSSRSGVKVPVPIVSPNTDSSIIPHGQSTPRQRKISTGSSMSERSSFSQDMDSPRVGIDERGAYPAPYPSPLHRSPSGASPIMASPRPDISPKAAAYPTINGQIRCGFYQDTVSNKSSPDKSCSPRENPQSPYPHYSEHVYTPNTTEKSFYPYTNSPYYTHPPNYSSTNPTPPYTLEGSSSYYDMSKSLTDQYQAKNLQNYTANSPSSNQSSPAHPQLSPSIHSPHSSVVHSPHSPVIHPQHSPGINSQHSPGVISPHSPGMYPQHSPNVIPQQSPGVHPNSPNMQHPQMSPNVQHSPNMQMQHSPNTPMQNSPNMQMQNSPNMPMQNSPNMQMQNSPNMQMQNSPNMQMQNSPNIQIQNSPNIQMQNSPNMQMQNSPGMSLQHSPNMQPQHSPSILAQQSSNVQTQSQDDEISEKTCLQQSPQGTAFPMKKRAYTEGDDSEMNSQNYDSERKFSQKDKNKNVQEPISDKSCLHNSAAKERENSKSYVQQSTADSKQLTIETPSESFKRASLASPVAQKVSHNIQLNTPPPIPLNTIGQNYPNSNLSNPFNSSLNNEPYSLNVPNARSLTSNPSNTIDMSKYTNMGYTGPDVNYSRTSQQFNRSEINSARTTIPSSVSQKQTMQVSSNSNISLTQGADTRMRYNNPNTSLQQMGYKSVEISNSTGTPQQAHNNFTTSNVRTTETDKLLQSQEIPSGFKPDVTVPRPTYNASTIDVDQPLGLGRSMSNLSHIVDRYNNDERVMAGLQTTSFYTDKGLGTSQLFNKPISTGTSGLPMFSQANMAAMQSYNQSVQGTPTSIYNRQVSDMQNVQNDLKGNLQVQMPEKKSKKRKNTKNVNPEEVQPTVNTSHQGFQSYAGLKGNSSIEPSAISLKTSSVVPGSAFNFGPTPSTLGIGPSLYGDKDAYPNFLEEFRSTPNYYMAAAAAAHHRSTPETSDKQSRVAHQGSNPQTAPGYPFLGAPPQARPTYPIGGPFIPNAQAQLMDTSSPLYQHYLQAGVLNQGLLGPPGAYPPGYHPALSIRQPYDSMTRPSWL